MRNPPRKTEKHKELKMTNNEMKINNLNKVFDYGTRFNTLKSFTAKKEEAIEMVRIHTEAVVYGYCVHME